MGLREKIQKYIKEHNHGAELLNSEEMADGVMTIIKEVGCVKLAGDQTLPSFRNAVNKSYNDYMLGQEDMLKAGFRKVEL